MELRQLRYFVAVAETGNISTAAKKIFLTQPALSRQIKALENEIGQCLLERRAHSIHLTVVGEGLLREARERGSDLGAAHVNFGSEIYDEAGRRRDGAWPVAGLWLHPSGQRRGFDRQQGRGGHHRLVVSLQSVESCWLSI